MPSVFGNRVSGEQILSDIANQIRSGPGPATAGQPGRHAAWTSSRPMLRDQTERVSVKAATFPVSELHRRRFPSRAKTQIERVLREVQEMTLPDGVAGHAQLQDSPPGSRRGSSRSTATLRRRPDPRGSSPKQNSRLIYENRKSEFIQPTGLPDDIFAGDPKAELTPPQAQPFEQVRPYLATSLSEDKAQAEIINRFQQAQEDEELGERLRARQTPIIYALDERLHEAQKSGEKTSVTLPKLKDLKAVAAKEGLSHEITPLLTREQAENYGQISAAEVGLTRLSGGRKFADEVFDAKTSLYEPVELTDALGRRFLARKIDDQAPRVPSLDEIRPEVALAWKLDQARPLAEKAAQAFAAKLRKEGGTIKGENVDGRPVITTPPLIRMQPGFSLCPVQIC